MRTTNLPSVFTVAVAVAFIPGSLASNAGESSGKQDRLQGRITSCTPNLREYQIREEPGGDWRSVDPWFTLPLS